MYPLLCCPLCKKDIFLENNTIICSSCSSRFSITENIPVFIDNDSITKHSCKQIDLFSMKIMEDLLNKVSKTSEFPFDAWHLSYIDKLRSSIPIQQENVIIDIGTGSGYMALELARRGNIVLACDINVNLLLIINKIAKKMNIPDQNLILFACDALNLPIKTNVVDIFILNGVLEHLEKDEFALNEISRICKKISYGFVSIPLSLKYVWPFFWLVNILSDLKLGHFRRYDEKSLKKLLSRYNFAIEKTFYTGHFVKVFGAILKTLFKINISDLYLEKIDYKKRYVKYGATNMISIIKRD